MIILKERDWAEEAIRQKQPGKKPFETYRRVARYYIDSGYDKVESRAKLERFFEDCTGSSPVRFSDYLDNVMKVAMKHEAVNIDCVPVTKKEIELINSLKGKQLKRLAFTLLCLAKYWDAVNPENDGWVHDANNDIMSMANIKTSSKRQGALFHSLFDDGLIKFSRKVTNTDVKVLYESECNDDVAIEITDFRNLGYQYLMYCGEPFFECECCGIVSKYDNPKVGRKQKYCKSCAKDIAIQQRVNAAMRGRSGKKCTC